MLVKINVFFLKECNVVAEDLQGVEFPSVFNQQINKTRQLHTSFLCCCYLCSDIMLNH